MQQTTEEYGSTALLQNLGMRFGTIGKTNPAQDSWNVQSFADGIGEPVKRGFTLLFPIVER